jgi:DNA-binding transcriptional LysR family regulator
MNIHQLRYFVEIIKHGSISKASVALYVSQPSISNSIKKLEEEVGATLIMRNNKGIMLTKEGEDIYKYAVIVLEQVDKIKRVSESDETSSLRVVSTNYSPVMEAFVKLCKEYESKSKVVFNIKNDDLMGVIKSVYNLESDIGVLLINKQSLELCESIIKTNNIEFFKLYDVSVNVNISKTNPLVSKEPFPFEELKDYMYVRYDDNNNTISYIPELSSLNIINPNKIISVTDRELKCNVVSQTNAFSIGCTLHPRFLKNFNIVAIPIPGNFSTLGYVKLKNSILSDEAKDFIKILRDILK